MGIYGNNPRFTLGSYVNQSARTTYSKDVKKVEYSVLDQDSGKYTRKVGNRYIIKHLIFDLSEYDRNLLLSYNATIQTYTPFYDKTNNRQVYVDAYFDPWTKFPSSFVSITLTDVEIDPLSAITNSGLSDWEWISYYLPDGSNDYLNNTHALTWGNAYTIAFSLKHPTGTILKGYPNYGGIYSFAYSYLDCYDYGNATLRAGDQSGNITDLSLPNGTFAVDNTEHKYIAIVNKITGYIAFYKDGNLVAEANRTVYIPTIPKEFLFGKYIGYINTAQVKNILITSHQFSATDITNYGSGNITAIDNKVLWYKCNEADTGAPYTDKALDSSGNGNHGTPVNITGATFFNQTGTGSHIAGSETFISQSLQPSLCPDSIMPKVVFGAYEYTFDNIQLEYEKRNMIDWEAESITGRLHRRYLTDASGNIRQESAIKITMFDISDSEYTLISRFDRQIVEYYPHASDGSSLYLAHFSVEWLTDTFDFAEIMIEPIGNSTAMSLSLTSPNGSESWKANTSQEITWISTGLLPSANVKLELYKNSVLDSVIIASTPNDGSYAWAIPYAQTVGADYKIKISGVEHTSVTDLSDADFAVTTPDLNTAGKGNGTDIYIDSGIKANAITDFEIDFVWQDLTSGADVLFGARYTLSYPDRIFYIQRDKSYTYVYFGNPSTDYIRYTSSVLFTNGNRYRIKISIVGTAITVTLTDLNSDIVIRTDSDTIGTLPNYNAYVFAKNNRDTAIENYTDIKIIRFKINTEEWNFSVGSGTSITGSLGTVLNIAGTLTNFWTIA
jgi:hypothetical protein